MSEPITKLSILFFVILFTSCEESEVIDRSGKSRALEEAFVSKSVRLSSVDPLNWAEGELYFLDEIAENTVIGLGEGTHGTAEFFDAKHRIFKYFVENHNIRILGIEADFGESLLINEAIQNGNCEALQDLMKEQMLYWIWNTEEVKQMLEWMCTYNLEQSAENKIQYFGFDSFSNRHNPGLLLNYLNDDKVEFFTEDISVLDRVIEMETNAYEDYSEEEASSYLAELDVLIQSLETNKDQFINASSTPEFELNLQLLKIVRQVVEVRTSKDQKIWSLRDQYMAENAGWLSTYFNNEKVVLWAHNSHVAKDELFAGTGSMGYHVSTAFPNAYESLIFLFSKGSFNAVTKVGSQSLGLDTQYIPSGPLQNSVNLLGNQTGVPVFYLDTRVVADLREWNNTLTFFDIGSSFGSRIVNFYKAFHPHRYDHIIYFDESTESKLLPR